MKIPTLLTLAFILGGCSYNTGSSRSNSSKSINQQASALNIDLQKTALKNARKTQVNGLTFQVAVIKEGSYTRVATDYSAENFVLKKNDMPYALVQLISPISGSYTGRDVEMAATRMTGCQATFSSGVLGLIGGFSPTTSNLNDIPKKAISNFKGWRTDLSC